MHVHGHASIALSCGQSAVDFALLVIRVTNKQKFSQKQGSWSSRNTMDIHVELSLDVYEASMVEHYFLSVVYATRMRINYKIYSAAVMYFI